jgi:hypothetical protein
MGVRAAPRITTSGAGIDRDDIKRLFKSGAAELAA